MYGQTEAAPRIAWLAHDEVMIAPDAIGRAVPGGRLSLRHEPGFPRGGGAGLPRAKRDAGLCGAP